MRQGAHQGAPSKRPRPSLGGVVPPVPAHHGKHLQATAQFAEELLQAVDGRYMEELKVKAQGIEGGMPLLPLVQGMLNGVQASARNRSLQIISRSGGEHQSRLPFTQMVRSVAFEPHFPLPHSPRHLPSDLCSFRLTVFALLVFAQCTIARPTMAKSWVQNSTGKPVMEESIEIFRGCENETLACLHSTSHQLEDDSLKYITTDAAPAGVGKILAANPGKMGRVVINSDEAISVLERIVVADSAFREFGAEARLGCEQQRRCRRQAAESRFVTRYGGALCCTGCW